MMIKIKTALVKMNQIMKDIIIMMIMMMIFPIHMNENTLVVIIMKTMIQWK